MFLQNLYATVTLGDEKRVHMEPLHSDKAYIHNAI